MLSHPLIPAGPGHTQVRQYLHIKRNRCLASDLRAAIEGLWLVRAAVDHGAHIEALIACPELFRGEHTVDTVNRLTNAGVPGFQVSRRTYLRLADRDGPDGLAAVVRLSSLNVADLTPDPAGRLLVLDSFELAGNVGSLIRCADAVAASAVILTEGHVRLNHPLLLKASMGTAFSVPLCSSSAATARTWLRRHGFWVLGADPAATTSYRDANYPARIAVVLGSERCGLSRFWKQASDQLVSIPMLGGADSLNVGHAGALILYEALHRQHGPPVSP